MNVDHECKNFRRNVAYLRKKHSLTQAQMAKIMNVGIGTVRSLERGIVPPRLNAYVLYLLHDHFHISIDSLFLSREN